jgi:hypothetical protein
MPARAALEALARDDRPDSGMLAASKPSAEAAAE